MEQEEGDKAAVPDDMLSPKDAASAPAGDEGGEVTDEKQVRAMS